jgi:uncharacterized protein (TIGR03435 family)
MRHLLHTFFEGSTTQAIAALIDEDSNKRPRPAWVDLLPAIKPALASQLGLTLRNAEAPAEILVIESIERPTKN